MAEKARRTFEFLSRGRARTREAATEISFRTERRRLVLLLVETRGRPRSGEGGAVQALARTAQTPRRKWRGTEGKLISVSTPQQSSLSKVKFVDDFVQNGVSVGNP